MKIICALLLAVLLFNLACHKQLKQNYEDPTEKNSISSQLDSISSDKALVMDNHQLKNQEIQLRKVPFKIDYEDLLKKKERIMLGSIGSDVHYIPLQTDSNCLVGSMPEFHFATKYIFVGNTDHVLVFDYNGKFIRKIGSSGNGPNEIDQIQMVSLIESEEVIAIQTLMSRKLLFYTYDGDILESVSVPMMSYIYSLGRNEFLCYDMCIIGNEDFVFRLTNRHNDTISSVRNHFKWLNESNDVSMLYLTGFQPFYIYDKRVYFKSLYNDTVFTILNSRIVPSYFIDLGKYRLPNEFRAENPASMDKFKKSGKNYFGVFTMQVNNVMFITAFCLVGKSQNNIIYYPNLGKGSSLLSSQNESSGLINNWDGGPDFWPEGIINDKKIYMTVSPTELKNLISEPDFTESKPLHINKKEEFIMMVEGLDENDNTVIMVVSLF